jgi:uncharacterized membrane protein
MPVFSIGDCIRYGWETFKKRPFLLIGALLVCALLPQIPSLFVAHPIPAPGEPPPPPTSGQIVAWLISIVIGILVSMGATNFLLRAHDDVMSVKFADLWYPDPLWRYLGAYILATLIIIAGFILLIVPGVIAGLGLMFVNFLVIDRGLGPTDAIKESWRLTKGYKWPLFLFSLALLLLNLAGIIALVIGVFVSAPVSWIALAHAYRTITTGR